MTRNGLNPQPCLLIKERHRYWSLNEGYLMWNLPSQSERLVRKNGMSMLVTLPKLGRKDSRHGHRSCLSRS